MIPTQKCISSSPEFLSKEDEILIRDWLAHPAAQVAVSVVKAKGAQWEMEALNRIQERGVEGDFNAGLPDARAALEGARKYIQFLDVLIELQQHTEKFSRLNLSTEPLTITKPNA